MTAFAFSWVSHSQCINSILSSSLHLSINPSCTHPFPLACPFWHALSYTASGSHLLTTWWFLGVRCWRFGLLYLMDSASSSFDLSLHLASLLSLLLSGLSSCSLWFEIYKHWNLLFSFTACVQIMDLNSSLVRILWIIPSLSISFDDFRPHSDGRLRDDEERKRARNVLVYVFGL